MNECPTAELLRGYLDEQLAADQADAVTTHVEQCRHCQQRIEQWFGPAAPPRPAPAPAAAGPPRVPGYEVQAPLGAGGMGVVYRALDLRLRRPVALKVLRAGPHTQPEELARFHAEARV